MKHHFKIIALFITVTVFIGCSDDTRIPAYLKDYQKEFKENPREANLQWFKNAEYGMFIHYGLYSLLEKGEWVQLFDTIPVAEYAKLKDRFTAGSFNADAITDLAISAGMKYITITSKHHDGFCLFSTQATDFNVINSPAKRDLIKELYDACEKKGLGLFLYYSYGADWKHPYFYSSENGWNNARPAYKEPQPEYKFTKDEDFKIYIDFVHKQLKELLTQYPNIAGIWFDPIMGYYHRPDLFPVDSTYSLIRKMSPHALISFKQGANGDEDFMAPERGGGAKVGQQFDVAGIAYEKNMNKPREICNTLQAHAWGYNKSEDGRHKSADDILEMLGDAKKSNANLLLNVGPKGDGSFPEEDIIALKEAGRILKGNDNNIDDKKVLYNGILLPEQWPPRYDEPDEPEEMPVPYLVNKPEVIPVNIGRQLFVDDFLIAETDLIYVNHTPGFYQGNPVLTPDKEWEIMANGDRYAAPYSDGIWYDEKDQKFKMWYLAGGPSFTTGYAESTDGRHWEKPLAGIYDKTNIIDDKRTDSQTIWLDKQEKDPEKRYKIFQIRGHPLRGRCNLILRYSADGLNWSDGKAFSGLIDDRSTAFYNPFRDVWVLSLRYWSMKYEEQMIKIDKPPKTRSRTYIENRDPEMAVSLAHYIREDVSDKNNVFWFGSSDKEPRNPRFPDVNPGIYNFDAIAYESIMLGFINVWQGPENPVSFKTGIDKRNEILLGYSRDGFHFSRPSYKPFMGVNEAEGSWNYANVQSINGAPVIVGDSLYFYSSGRSRNKYSVMSTGLATLRRDGFVSMKAGNQEGYLTTEKLNFDGKYLFVNADVEDGQLIVEVIDDKGSPLKGYTRHDCVPMQNENSTKHMITWNNRKDLLALKGENISFKYFLTKGEIYAFWVSPWETGESRGYTAGGGPGLSFDGIDRP